MKPIKNDTILDFIAIGVGPFNLGLACLTSTIDEVEGVFLDQKDEFNWHPGMLLQDTTLQVPFMADLVTLADPTHPLSFLNYLKEQGRIYAFYIRENFLMLRNEYNLYCKWAIQKLDTIQFHTKVTAIQYHEDARYYALTAVCTKTDTIKTYRAKKIVLGTGTQPHLPQCTKHLKDKTIHSASYLTHKAALQSKKTITVVGSGQSAAEIFYDLLQEVDTKGYALHWMTRSARFFPLEYTKLTLEMTSPEYVDYFYDLPKQTKTQLLQQQKSLYKGINQDLIAAIFDTIYTKKLTNSCTINLHTNAELQKTIHDTSIDRYYLEFYQQEQHRLYTHQTDGLIFATGYSYKQPDFINGIKDRIQWDAQGQYDVHRNYSIDNDADSIFVQNAELHTHGFVTPDLGMACYRNSYLIKEITGVDHYPIEKKIAFQNFGVPEEETISVHE